MKEEAPRPEDLRELARRTRVIASVMSEPQRGRVLAAAAEIERNADELDRHNRHQQSPVVQAQPRN